MTFERQQRGVVEGLLRARGLDLFELQQASQHLRYFNVKEVRHMQALTDFLSGGLH